MRLRCALEIDTHYNRYPTPKARTNPFQKRKRTHARGKREVAQTVQRSKIYRHSLLGGLGLDRETGRVGISSRESATRRVEACAGLFERHSLLDFKNSHEWLGRISTLGRDLRTGLLFVGGLSISYLLYVCDAG